MLVSAIIFAVLQIPAITWAQATTTSAAAAATATAAVAVSCLPGHCLLSVSNVSLAL